MPRAFGGMHKPIFVALALPLFFGTPVVAQDILRPLQEMVESLTAPPAPQPSVSKPAAPKATAPVAPPVPRPRPPELPDVPEVAAPTAPGVEGVAGPEATPETEEAVETETEPATAPAPEAEARIYQAACPAVLNGLVEAEMVPPLNEGICGEQSPMIVTGVLSRGRTVPLSTPVTTNCQMASALPDWVETVDGYAEAMLESPLAQIDTGTSYMCRGRNNAEGGFTSEHGFANALDVTGFTLEDGRSVGVLGDWIPAAEPAGRLLRLAHDAACGAFTTVLGPEANAEHRDHLHLDLGCHGASCTARICE